jgi:thiol-disulfide isomerase/thioredoxin
MKKSVLFIVAIITFSTAFSQYDTTAPYLKTKVLPNFKLLTLDSTLFNESVIQEGKNTLIMLFNPECEHCQHQLQLMLTIPELTQSANVILTSTETLQKIKIFYDKYHLENYPMIHIGKDYSYFFGGYYQPKTIPVLAFYNKERKLVYFNQGSVKKNIIEETLRQ